METSGRKADWSARAAEGLGSRWMWRERALRQHLDPQVANRLRLMVHATGSRTTESVQNLGELQISTSVRTKCEGWRNSGTRHLPPVGQKRSVEPSAAAVPDLRGTGARGSCVNPMPDDPRRSRGGGAGPGERPRTPPGLCPPACRSPPAAWPGSQQAMGRYRSVARGQASLVSSDSVFPTTQCHRGKKGGYRGVL